MLPKTPSPSSFFSTTAATPKTYTLSLHDALPICGQQPTHRNPAIGSDIALPHQLPQGSINIGGLRLCLVQDRKSTRLNSSHSQISYAVFCLKKKKLHKNIARLSVLRDFQKKFDHN